MAEAQEKLLAQLSILRERYAAELPQKIAELRAGFQTLRNAGDSQDQVERWRTLHRQTHSLTGSGGTFGFMELSAACRVLEHALKPLALPGAVISTAELASLERLLGAVENTLSTADVNATKLKLAEARGDVSASPDAADDRRILLVTKDDELIKEHRRQYELHGYTVSAANDLAELAQTIVREKPRAIVLDILFAQGEIAGIQEIATLRKTLDAMPAVVFVSSKDDLDTRLASVRAGIAAYFTRPYDVSEVVETLDRLTAHEQNPGYRVLIVDDDQHLAEHNALLLRGAGMQVRVLTEPQQVLEVLPGFRPDLILMDLYLPLCTGIELAAVIRQQSAYTGVPIVFFSVETDLTLHLDAMRAGGDDFLIKPITPARLIATVSARAKRARAITATMVRDSLTNLLNHGHIEEQLLRELNICARQKGVLSYALLDLDHFKSVNDKYGHAAGDKVLQGLSRLLRQRFRQTDLIGRYGGEEFVVVFPNTDVQAAARLIDQMRIDFSRIPFQHGEITFQVTLSAGLASAPEFPDANSLQAEADRALYRAKDAGRNQIMIATSQER